MAAKIVSFKRRAFMASFPAFIMASPPAFGAMAGRGGVKRIIEGWYAHNAVLLMLGAAPDIIATIANPVEQPWLFRLVPSLTRAAWLHNGTLNNEALARLDGDIVILPVSQQEQADQLRRAGLNVVVLDFRDFSSLMDMVDETASLLATPLAAQRARSYRHAVTEELAYYDSVNNDGQNKICKRHVLHIARLSPLQVDGQHTMITSWINASGGQNVADIRGDRKIVSAEQILVWNPDVIILAANAGLEEILYNNPVFSQLDAVKNRAVFRNPAGVFLWERYGPELLLQLKWARQILADGQVNRQEMTGAICEFYHDFYGIVLTEKEAGRILSALPPSA